MEQGGYVYILTNENNTVLYTGVTSKLRVRLFDHRSGKYPRSFTHRYNCYQLVYYKFYDSIDEAISREKQIRAGSRARKEKLINSINPEWKDLSNQIEDLLD